MIHHCYHLGFSCKQDSEDDPLILEFETYYSDESEEELFLGQEIEIKFCPFCGYQKKEKA